MTDFTEAEGRIAWFHGEFLPLEQVSISPFDRGFLFADGVYEGLRWYSGHGVFRLGQHLARLQVSLDTLRIEGVDLAQFESAVPELVRRNDLAERDATIYLQVTRGVAPRTHRFPDPAVTPTCMALVRSFDPPRSEQETGVDVALVEDLRWGRCDIKSVALLANVLAKEDAVRAGAFEAIFVRDDLIIEGSHTAVLAVREGVLIAPPNGPQILPSVTREVVLEMATQMGIGIELRSIERSELGQVDELMLLGTSTEVMGVVRVDGRRVGAGVVGPVTRRLQAAWPPIG
ncbi:D-amino acid aminotransferase [bacterium]|nr:MAG: D-amino acid aminotransferase [bacterium]